MLLLKNLKTAVEQEQIEKIFNQKEEILKQTGQLFSQIIEDEKLFEKFKKTIVKKEFDQRMNPRLEAVKSYRQSLVPTLPTRIKRGPEGTSYEVQTS